MATKPTSFLETFAMKSTSPTTSTALHPPEPMGIDSTKAYGGCTLGVAVNAAANAVPPNYCLYSLANILVWPSQYRVLSTSIREIRQTRTFATRLVEVSHKSNSGQDRACLIVLANSQVPEPASLLEYSATPTRPYTDHSKLEGENEQRQEQVDAGKLPQVLKDDVETIFGLMARFFETRPCPEGVFAQDMNGLMKQAPTTQNRLPVPQKSSADWVRSLEKLPDHAEYMAALAFLLDGATGFVTLAFSNMFLDDAGAASSLDFALRVFDNRVDVAKWHLREVVTHVAAEGRTYAELKPLGGGWEVCGEYDTADNFKTK